MLLDVWACIHEAFYLLDQIPSRVQEPLSDSAGKNASVWNYIYNVGYSLLISAVFAKLFNNYIHQIFLQFKLASGYGGRLPGQTSSGLTFKLL